MASRPTRASPIGAGPSGAGLSSELSERARQIEELIRQGREAQASMVAMRWVSHAPDDLQANRYACAMQHRSGNETRALHYAQRCVQLAPQDADQHMNLARILNLLFRPGDAEASMRRALELAPDAPEPAHDLCLLLAQHRRYAESLRMCEQVLRRFPEQGDSRLHYLSLLVSTGRVVEALEKARELAKSFPSDVYSRSLACLVANYTDLSAAEQFQLHEDFGAAVARLAPPRLPVPSPAPMTWHEDAPSRPVRVGVLSPDLRAHSVTFFLLPLLQHLDAARFEVFAYHTNKLEDHVTARLRRLCRGWWGKNNAPADEVAARMIEDRIDVLLDLAGHTQPNGLLTASLRPARTQITWLGYPNTTGLRAMDARLVDSHTDPLADDASPATLAREQLLRLDPCFLCYEPPSEAPATENVPTQDTITFVSFNTLQKTNARCAGVWARVLERVPGSRLLLKMTNLMETELSEQVAERLAGWGLARDRVRLLSHVEKRADHLQLYSGTHVGLDTFPYHGTTTTCEALWMGVPVVTLAGATHASRVGVSLMHAIGTPELIAHSEDAYVDKAATLAQDSTRLRTYRATLRERMRASPLCDGPGFAKRWEAAVLALHKARSSGAK
jgi:protein O-GlcNAc transferase